jgi:hypothetical protein
VKPGGIAHIASFLSPFPFHTRSFLYMFYDFRFYFLVLVGDD